LTGEGSGEVAQLVEQRTDMTPTKTAR